MGVGGQHRAPATLPRNDPVPTVHEARCAPGLVWTSMENLTPPVLDPWTVKRVASS